MGLGPVISNKIPTEKVSDSDTWIIPKKISTKAASYPQGIIYTRYINDYQSITWDFINQFFVDNFLGRKYFSKNNGISSKIVINQYVRIF